MSKYILYALIIVIAFSTPLFAAPSISPIPSSQVFLDGSTITISGSNFGTKSAAAPVKWDDFSGGSSGSQLSTVLWPAQTAIGGPILPTYSTTRLRPNDTMSVKTVMTQGSQYNCSFGYDSPGKRYWYISYWRHDTYTGSVDNYKHFRIYGTAGSSNLQAYFTELPNNTATFGVQQEGGGSGGTYQWTSQGTRNAWTREEFYIDMGTRGNADGKATMWRDASVISNINFSVPALQSGYTGELGLVRIGHYNRNVSGVTSYFSEVYIDNTQARVEIGDAPSWSANSHREIQIPSAWSSNSITFTVNQGSLPDCGNYYLYVVDANGVPSSGIPIRIVTGTGKNPCPPVGLKIIP